MCIRDSRNIPGVFRSSEGYLPLPVIVLALDSGSSAGHLRSQRFVWSPTPEPPRSPRSATGCSPLAVWFNHKS
eukprot:10253596-Alexandrium_andersonii.AAC.3